MAPAARANFSGVTTTPPSFHEGTSISFSGGAGIKNFLLPHPNELNIIRFRRHLNLRCTGLSTFSSMGYTLILAIAISEKNGNDSGDVKSGCHVHSIFLFHICLL
jgi:hypothetical protein